MKRILLLLTVLSFAITLQAQTDLVSSAGQSNVTADGTLSWSLGEVAIARQNSQTYDLAEGFHRSTITILKLVTSIEEVTEIASLSVYPNPTTSLLNISIPEHNGNVDYNLYSLKGQQVYNGKMPANQKTQSLDVGMLASGTYILIIADEVNKKQSSFKIIKSN